MKKYGIIGCIWVIIIILNLLAWNSSAFCDWYVANIFPFWVGAYGRLTSLFPFSVGEVMLVAAAVSAVILIIVSIAAAICKIIYLIQKKKKKKIPVWMRRYGFGMLILFTCVGTVMSGNCFVLYHCSTFPEKYMEKTVDKKYKLSELTELRNFVVSECNRLSKLVDRDEYGNVIYEGDIKAQDRKSVV